MTRSSARTTRDLTADYIIVGAGSAGAALAARLSEDPAASVLLLEAGAPDQALELHVPAAFSKLFRGEYDWNYDTVPQPALEEPDDLLAARQDARRLVVAERDDVDPRVRGRLRRLGGCRRAALVVEGAASPRSSRSISATPTESTRRPCSPGSPSANDFVATDALRAVTTSRARVQPEGGGA